MSLGRERSRRGTRVGLGLGTGGVEGKGVRYMEKKSRTASVQTSKRREI